MDRSIFQWSLFKDPQYWSLMIIGIYIIMYMYVYIHINDIAILISTINIINDIIDSSCGFPILSTMASTDVTPPRQVSTGGLCKRQGRAPQARSPDGYVRTMVLVHLPAIKLGDFWGKCWDSYTTRVGGLEHDFYFSKNVGNHHPKWYFSEGLKPPTNYKTGWVLGQLCWDSYTSMVRIWDGINNSELVSFVHFRVSVHGGSIKTWRFVEGQVPRCHPYLIGFFIVKEAFWGIPDL